MRSGASVVLLLAGVVLVTGAVAGVAHVWARSSASPVSAELASPFGSGRLPASPTIAITNPRPDSSVSGEVAVHAVTSGDQVTAVEFWTDGMLRATDDTAPYAWVWNTDGLSGEHAVGAVAVQQSGNRVRARDVSVRFTAAPTSPPSPPPRARWSAGFEQGDFSGWDTFGPGDRYAGDDGLWPVMPAIRVVDPSSEGIPPAEGAAVARFEVSESDVASGKIHAKLYKHFGPGMPADVSGTYRAWYYLPTNFTVPFSRDAWVSLFQWKEWANGGASQDPLWSIQIRPRTWMDQRPYKTWIGSPPAGGDDPVAYANHWNADNDSRPLRAIALPRGRWFEVRADLFQNDRIDFYIDGQFLQTAHHSQYPVSPFHDDPGGFFVFGIGNYGTASGVLYADAVSVAPISP